MKRRRTLFTPGGSCWPRMRISQASSNAPISTETPRASCSSKGRSITLWKAGGSSATYPNRRLPLWSPSAGTGDLVTGLVTGLLAGGMEMPQACLTAARASRITGLLANPTPATQIAELLPFLPEALRCALEGASPPCPPPGRETVQTRAAPSLRILTEKPPSSRLGAFFTRQPEPFQAIPMATTFPESPFRWISFAHPTNTKRPDRLSI